ncbi:MAG TPA: hypothetical protein VJR67_00805 [Candidatus Nitrosopolaris sp.]|nr:hypothetical protein [Candidatus Nitrosopolaris sp.]
MPSTGSNSASLELCIHAAGGETNELGDIHKVTKNLRVHFIKTMKPDNLQL